MGWLAGAHVAAKRYLVATDPGYGAALSDDVGGLAAARRAAPASTPTFVAHPWWPDALRLRRYDDAAKDPDGDAALRSTTCWPIAERVAAPTSELAA